MAALAGGWLAIACSPWSLAAPVVWDADSGTDLLWSTAANWAPDGSPAGNDVTFNATASSATPGSVTNIVNGDFTVSSLTYSLPATSGATTSLHHTTQINAGHTLTVNGVLIAGIPASGATPTPTQTTASVTIKGATPGSGALVVNSPGNIVMGPSDSTYNNGVRNLTIDLRDLGTFSATAADYFYLGSGHADPVTLYLAASNTITAGKLTMGPWNATDTIYLGQANTLNVDAIIMGGDVPGAGYINAATCRIEFRGGLTAPTVAIRNKAGTGRADLTVGLGANQNSTMTSHLDLTGSAGAVDALLNRLVVGQGYPSTTTGAAGVGTLTFGAGSIDASTVLVGYTTSDTRTGNNGVGTLNIQGPGTLTAATLTLADQNPAGLGTATGTVNLNGGTLRAGAVQKGAGAGTAAFNWSAGTVSHVAGGDLTVHANMPLTLLTTAAHTFDAQAGRAITVHSAIAESGAAAPVVKTGDGTLVFNAANAYSGATTVLGGKLVLGTANALKSGNALSVGGASGISANSTLDVLADQALGSLSYLFTNAHGANYQHTTTIASGATLTVNGPFSSGVIPVELPSGNTAAGRVNLTGASPGAGALVVHAGAADINVGTSVYGWPTGVRNFTLDMTGLGSFSAATTGRFYLGHGSNDNTTLTLAGANTITANVLALAGWGSTSTINLGASNALNVNTITIAGGVPTAQNNGGSGVIRFASGLVGPSVTIRNAAGTGRANVTVGLGGDTNTANTGTLDLTAGSVDALIGTLIVGQGYPHATQGAGGTGVLSFAAGTIDATTVRVGYTAPGTRAANFGTGTLNVSGTGTLVAGTLLLADQQGDGAATGTVNLNGGTVRAGAVQKGAGAGTAAFNWSAGTVSHVAGGDLTVHANVPLTLLTTAAHTFSAEAGRAITVHAPVVQSGAAAGITKTGPGTLVLTNPANAYTGATGVAQGTLLVHGSIASSSGVAVAGGAVLGGTGQVPAIAGAGLVSPGASPGILTAPSVDPGAGLDFAFEFTRANQDPDYGSVAASANDVLRLTGLSSPFTAALGGDNTVGIYLDVDSLDVGDTFRGGFYADRGADFLSQIGGADFEFFVRGDGGGPVEFLGTRYYPLGDFGDASGFHVSTVPSTAEFVAAQPVYGYVMQLTAVPEPSAFVLGALGLAALVAWALTARE